MRSDAVEDDVRFTLYRLGVVEAMPDSPRRTALLEALHQRLNRLEAARAEQLALHTPVSGELRRAA